MITLIEAVNYRCLKSVRQELGPFHVLVGPNASGKTTFLDAIAFLRDLMAEGVEAAVGKRGDSIYDLTWGRRSARFEIATEIVLPEFSIPAEGGEPTEDAVVRYEVAIGISSNTKKVAILDEQIARKEGSPYYPSRDLRDLMGTVFSSGRLDGWSYLRFPREASASPSSLRLSEARSVLGTLDFEEFPVESSLLTYLVENVHAVSLDSPALRAPSAPGQGTVPTKDGSNLPWVIHDLQQRDPERFSRWVQHLQTALPRLVAVTTVERPEDHRRYLMLEFADGMKVPSWALSDGTLRLMALTVIAYAPQEPGLWLVEEPENCVHPRNLETIMQSLSSVYGGQVMVTTHSPAILALADLDQILAFRNPGDDGAHIVTGRTHPNLAHWKGETSISTLFASGVLE